MTFSATYPFTPPQLPPGVNLEQKKLFQVTVAARSEIGELKGYTLTLPNPLLLLSPLILRESVASSGVENIHTTVTEALQMQLFPERERSQPDKEVIRYQEALMDGFAGLKKLPIVTRLITEIQQRLLPAEEGRYRRVQNRIQNWATGEIVYTPPEPQQIPGLVDDWEKFVNKPDTDIDPLIRCAMAHYQFEAIHPFKDGNGRTGRIIMVLQMVYDGLLDLPVLFVSGYLLKRRGDYYNLLLNISKKGEWLPFLLFMLEAFESQARDTKEMLLTIRTMIDRLNAQLQRHHSKIFSAALAEVLFSFPLITPSRLAQELGIHRTTASRYLNELAKGKLLESSVVGKYRIFANQRLVRLLSKGLD